MAILASISSSPTTTAIADQVSKILSIPHHPITIEIFPDGECKPSFTFPATEGPLFLFQTFAHTVNSAFVETFLTIDALKRAGQKEIILVAPYLPYSRQSPACQLFVKLFEHSGLSRLITVHLHEQHGADWYDIPMIQLMPVEVLVAAIRRDMAQYQLQKLCVVAPDFGAARLANMYAEKLGIESVVMKKRRLDSRHVEVVSIQGDVQGKLVLLADDVCSTAGTLASAAKACREKNAQEVIAAVSHSLLVGNATALLKEAGVSVIWTTDSCAPFTEPLGFDLRVQPLAPLLAGCIKTLIAPT